MYKKSLYKTLNSTCTKTFSFNKWNTIQVFSIGAQLYQNLNKIYTIM